MIPGIRKTGKNLYWRLRGLNINNPVLPQKIHHILFICKGNICRSPFAEKAAKRVFGAQESVSIESAGIHVESSLEPPGTAVDAALHYGVDLKDHGSRQITYSMMESCDIVMTMEPWHSAYLSKVFAEHSKKIFLLPLFNKKENKSAYRAYNIQDPYGRSYSEYRECFDQIVECVDNLYNIMKYEQEKQ